MHRFNRPPGWPVPPEPDWQPPRGWLPDPNWPQPPKGWRFWVNERGGRALGPAGVYGSTSRGGIVAGASVGGVALIALLALVTPNSSAASSDSPTAGATVTATATATTTATATATVTETVSPAASTITVTPPPRVVTMRPAPVPRVTVTKRIPFAETSRTSAPVPTSEATETGAYYASCSEARAAGVAPLYRGDPGYRSGLDRDDDGVACE